MDKNGSNQREWEGANNAQIISKEVKKAFCKHLHKSKKRRVNDSESDSNSNYSSWSCVSDSTGESYMYKKRKLNISVNEHTYPSQNKAIQQNEFELNNKINLKAMQENDLKKSCNKKNCH